MRPLGGGILGHGRIDPREREIVIHRACARAGAEYEWGVHAAAFGRTLGFSDEQLHSTVHGAATDDCWAPEEALAFALADELFDTAHVSDELADRLSAAFADDEILELTLVAGWYRTISTLIDVTGVELEDWAERFPPA
jgi:alkylhydroperoxidase family enzyme